MPRDAPPWRAHVIGGTATVILFIAGAFIWPRLFPPAQRNLDGMISVLGTIMTCFALAFVAALITAVWVGDVARRAGRRYPLSGLIPLGIIGGLVALGIAVAYLKPTEETPRQENLPTAAPAMPVQPKPEP